MGGGSQDGVDSIISSNERMSPALQVRLTS